MKVPSKRVRKLIFALLAAGVGVFTGVHVDFNALFDKATPPSAVSRDMATNSIRGPI